MTADPTNLVFYCLGCGRSLVLKASVLSMPRCPACHRLAWRSGPPAYTLTRDDALFLRSLRIAP
ncbi:MAG: hypothetical protein AB7H81_23650 [Vicinamibacterales bacterium]